MVTVVAGVDPRAMINVGNVNDSAALVNPVHDPIGAATGTTTTCQRHEQRLANPVRIHRQPGLAELQHSSGNALRKPLGDRSPFGWLEPDLVPLPRYSRHLPVARRRARSWRTVAMTAPGSPRSSAPSLYWADRNGRWHRYDDLDPGPVDSASSEIEADPTCIFWG
jgi:Protein of unknown function (DUF3024)